MRKWMREKLKRRKKMEEEAANQPAPLQPAYFETANEPAAPEPEPEPQTTEPAGSTESASGQSDVQGPPSVNRHPSERAGNSRRPRRRRGRGGRGRRRTAPVPDASVPVASAPETAGIPAPEVSAAPPKASKGIVVLSIGLPGSGKSSWFKRHKITPLSSDLLRALLFDDPEEQRFQDLVVSNLRSMLRARLIARRPLNYVDATNLTPHERSTWIKLARDFGYEVQAVYFDVPLDICLERNSRRPRVVPEDVMHRMATKLKAPTFDEGFSKITVVRVKPKE